MNFLGSQKFEVCFDASYLYLNESKRDVDLIDFRENRPECLSDINPQKMLSLKVRARLPKWLKAVCTSLS